ncbi:hypothetical protein QL285_091433 [Trifolium repens]|nr:hypothetical protein QL285_091433 [Trifolium repens]
MGSLIDCYQFLWSPRLKARLKEHLVHLKLYEARLGELDAAIQNLKKARDTVQHKVDEEDNRFGRGIPVKVKEWIAEVIATIYEYEKFVNEEEDHQLAVFDLFKSGYLPKTGIRYQRSRKAFDITRRVNGLLQTANHDTFSYWLGPPSMNAFFHTIGYESFSSRDETMKKIKEDLKSPNATMIGLHGLSGVGKTTLVKEIGNGLQASEATKMIVAMANVTRKPDIRKIQGHIADMLGMKLDEESDIARAARIRRRLKNEKESTLIILDDLWSALDLNMLGIPLENDDDGEYSRIKTMKETSFEHVKDGKILRECPSRTETMKETPLEHIKEGKKPGERFSRTKTMKETPSLYLKDGKTPMELNTIRPEKHNSAISMIKSRKFSSTSNNVKTEEALSHHKGCKVLLISESKQVLLSQMEGKENTIYFLDVLKDNEAEALFKKMAGVSDRNSVFDKFAVQIASKCNGLPMSIVTTARALKNQSRSRWEDAFRKLEWQKFTGAPELSTRLSYDHLEDEELKCTFLTCACMGPDALIMDLVKYCIGLGFLQGIYTVKEARSRVYALVGRLKVSGLLSDSHSSDHFTMSDIVRRAALSIASEEQQQVFTLTDGKVDEWPDEDKLERYAAISLHHCDINEGFPSRINFLKLRFFHVNNIDHRLEIPENIFEGMRELRVLRLSGVDLSPFPLSVRCLTKLRMLCLENCKLGEKLSIIGELKKLRVLNFSGSDIEKLPVELKYLTKLQIFDISNCSKLNKIPSHLISSLISLEELYMRNTLIQWEVKEQTYESENASLSELRHLNQLQTLDIQIPNASHLPMNLFFDKLYSYKIVIGDLNAYSEMDFKIPEKYEASRFLAIQLKDGFDIHSQMGIKMLFERVEYLFLEDLHGVKDIFYMLNLKGFPYLRHLLVVNNSNIQSLVNPKERRHPEKAFPKLESLYLYNLDNFDKICSCKLSIPSFGKLKIIKINLCGSLENVFSISMVRLLTLLETIEVSECYALREIVEVETHNNTSDIEVLDFAELRSLTLQSFSDQFIGFYPISSKNGERRTLFNEKVIVSKLQKMELSSIHIDTIWSDHPPLRSCFQNLVHLDVNGCGNLEYLISFPLAQSLENLQSLFLSKCEKMINIFPRGQGTHDKKGIIFPNLKKISLSNMKSFKEIWNSELPSNSFGNLSTLIIEKCDKFVTVFPCYMEGICRRLCDLRVTNCKSMKAVFELDDKKRNDGDVTNLQDVYLETLPKLEHVWKWSKDNDGILEFKSLQKMLVRDCHSLENLFPVSIAKCLPSLEYLAIAECFGLREIVANGEGINTDTSNPDPSFEFPKLTTIKFSKLPKLSCFYPGPYKLSCPALNDLSIGHCDRLDPFRKEATGAPTLFSEEVINKLTSMQIDSWHAKSSSSYIGEGNHRQDSLEELCLSRLTCPDILYSFLHSNPNLKSLLLKNCSFTDIVPLKMPPEIKNMGVVPKLKSLKLINLSDLETIGFERDTILQRIEVLILNNCPCLVNIMHSSVALTHLTKLEVVNCGALVQLIPISVAKSLVQLNSMKVINCESIVEIVGNDEENAGKVDIVFRQLKVLELVSLKNLICFSKNCAFEFPSLEKVVVSACPKMEFFSKEVKSTQLLQKIHVVHEKEQRWCWKDDLNSTIQEIFLEKMFFEGMDKMSLSEHHELKQAWHCDVDLKSGWFYSLKTLKLDNCDIEPYAVPSNILPYLKSLKELEIRDCNKVKVIFGKNDAKTIPFQLNNLTLAGLPGLTFIWEKDCRGILRFQNLQQISVSDCEIVQTLFPAVLAKNLKMLEKLEIKSCAELRQIVRKEEDAATGVTEKFVFPCLTMLDLSELAEITYFYPEIFIVECPKLNHLNVLDCPKLVLFPVEYPVGEAEAISTSINRHSLISDLNTISNLEELSLAWKHISLLKFGQHTEDLKYLNEILLSFRGNDEPTLPLEILEKAPNLQDMTLGLINSLKIFLTPNPRISEQRILGQLKILTLNCVCELQCISLENSWLSTVCETLDELNIMNCPDLREVFHSPSAMSFSYLKDLYINGCHELEYLFTSSVAKVLMHLERVMVKRSQSIKEIVAKEKDGTSSQGIKFEWLYCIHLDSLSSLECFYSGIDALELPSLSQVDVRQCPKMQVFSRGEINVKSFKGIQASYDSNDELVFDNDLNSSVKRVFLLQMLSEGMDKMSFSKYPEIQEAWHAGHSLQTNLFYSLKTLTLDNCGVKQYAIPSNILPCLKNLKDLQVRNCDKVKIIFCMNGTGITETAAHLKSLTLERLSELTLVWEENCQGILRFQNLQQVSVCDCNSMQTLFPAALAKNLKKLEQLQIESCNELREIVGKEEVAAIDVTKKIVFPRLTSLHLDCLPNLTSLYPEIISMEFPKLKNLCVIRCPKLELFQGAYHNGEGESTSMERQHLFFGHKDISILEELSLDWKHISLLRVGQHTDVLKYLNKIFLCFDENEEPTLPLEILEKAHNLQDLTLALINNLKIFLTPNLKISEHRILGQLKMLTLNLSELQCISLEGSWLNTVCEKLDGLNVMGCPGLTKIFHSPSVVFSCLKNLYITECHGLEYLFTSSAAKVLMQLESITVERSRSIKEIVAKQQDGTYLQGIKFERLHCILLDSLSSLECFYSGNDTLQLTSLTQVDIRQCPNMQIFSQGEIYVKSFNGIQVTTDSTDELVFDVDLNTSVKRVFLLQMLSEGMNKVSFSKHPEIQEAWHAGHSLKTYLFYSLKTLTLDNCGIEQYAIPSNILSCLKSLKDLRVRNCDKVKVIFCMNDTGISETSPQLNCLTLEGLPELTLVWEKNCKGILRFENLQQVSVSDCKSMQTLFPAALAKNLKKLEKLEIECCDELREIVGKEVDPATGVTEKFVFPCLTTLDLSELPEIIYFYPEIFSMESPKLKSLCVLECPKLELFQGAHPDSDGEGESSCNSIKRQHLFSCLKDISILQELSLDWKHISLLKSEQHTEDLKYLNKIFLCFDGNEEPILPLEILEKAQNLQDLTLGLISSLQIFLTHNPKVSEHGILGQLKVLTLLRVSELQCINLEDSWLNTVCEKLVELNVMKCPGLTKIFHSPSTVTFSYLKDLYINRCHGLEYLFTSSVAKVLMHLERIIVKRSQSIKEIVAKEQDETNSQGIKFEWLNCIHLDSLSSLECFYSGNDTLQLPSLNRVDIWQCPKMKVFSQGEINAKSFRGIQASADSNDKLVFDNDLNTSVKKVFLLQVQ